MITSLTSDSSQGMVPRADLVTAISDANNAREELAARVRDCAALEAQLSRAQEQLGAMRAESGQLQLAVSGMAPMADLRAARSEASKWRGEAEALKARVDAMAPLADLEAERCPPPAPRSTCICRGGGRARL
jgi:predicted  nucleic acid-binding Zn-ribbon protein